MDASSAMFEGAINESGFVILPSSDTEPKFGLLCSTSANAPMTPLFTLWKQVGGPYSNVLDILPCVYGEFMRESGDDLRVESEQAPNSDSSAQADLTEKRRAAVMARWQKERSKQELGERKCASMTEQRQKQRTSRRETGTQTKLSCLGGSCNEPAAQTQMVRLGVQFIAENMENFSRKSPRYSDTYYDIAALLYLSSPKTYRIARQMVVLPAVASIYRQYAAKFHETSEKILSLTKLHQSISEVTETVAQLQRSGGNVNPVCTLGIDAFCFRSFSGTTLNAPAKKPVIQQIIETASHEGETSVVVEGSVTYNYGFLFLLIPHDYRLPIKLVHLCATETGCYNASIARKADEIRKVTRAAGLHIWCKATDGDPGVSSDHNDFFLKCINGKSSNFQKLVISVHKWLHEGDDRWAPIADPLHVLKNMRARMLAHTIMLYSGCPTTSLESMRRVLNVGSALSDDSQIGKMRDAYVVSLFTFENVYKLMRAGHYVEACLLFPFACWTAVIFSDGIELQLRLFLVELAFQLIHSWYVEASSLVAAGVRTRGAANQVTTFCDSHYTRRILNTLVMFGVALTFGCENMRMDALGTHLVENSIGIARASSNDPRYERIIQTYTHSEVKKEIAAKLGISLYVHGRVNHGGCKVDPDHQCVGKSLKSKPDGWRVDSLLQLFRGMCQPETAEFVSDQRDRFLSELKELVPILDKHEYNTNRAANCGIMARIISFSKKEPGT